MRSPKVSKKAKCHLALPLALDQQHMLTSLVAGKKVKRSCKGVKSEKNMLRQVFKSKQLNFAHVSRLGSWSHLMIEIWERQVKHVPKVVEEC